MELMYKIVRVHYLTPKEIGSSIYQYPDSGRMIKSYKDKTRVLIVNPECKTENDIHWKSSVFKWGYWVDVNEATFEEIKKDD